MWEITTSRVATVVEHLVTSGLERCHHRERLLRTLSGSMAAINAGGDVHMVSVSCGPNCARGCIRERGEVSQRVLSDGAQSASRQSRAWTKRHRLSQVVGRRSSPTYYLGMYTREPMRRASKLYYEASWHHPAFWGDRSSWDSHLSNLNSTWGPDQIGTLRLFLTKNGSVRPPSAVPGPNWLKAAILI